MIRSSPRISSGQYQFLSAEVDIAVLTSELKNYFYTSIFVIVQIKKKILKLRLTCQNDIHFSGFGIHFLGLFCFLYV